jgi:hypothetical protein
MDSRAQKYFDLRIKHHIEGLNFGAQQKLIN